MRVELPADRHAIASCEVVLDDTGMFHVAGHFMLLCVIAYAADPQKLEDSLLMLGIAEPPPKIAELQQFIRGKRAGERKQKG